MSDERLAKGQAGCIITIAVVIILIALAVEFGPAVAFWKYVFTG